MTTTAKIVNPDSGHVVHEYVEIVPEAEWPEWWLNRRYPTGRILVAIKPSFRPGMPYDLTDYDESWIVPLDPEVTWVPPLDDTPDPA